MKKNLPIQQEKPSDVPKKHELHKDVIEFQSDLTEIEQHKLPAQARSTLYVLMLFLAIMFIWSCIAEVDKTITASGEIVTTGKNILIQPLEDSILKTLEVSLAQKVKAGDVVATLDPTFSASDLSQLYVQLYNLDAKIMRLKAELLGKPFEIDKNIYESGGMPLEYEDSESVDALKKEALQLQLSLYNGRMQEYNSKIESYDESISRLSSNVKSLEYQEKNLSDRTKNTEQILSMRQEVYSKGADSKLSLLEAERLHSETLSALQSLKKDLASNMFEKQKVLADKSAFISGWRNDLSTDLTDSTNKRGQLLEDINKKQRLQELTELTAPVDSIVLELGKFTAGSVVEKGETIMTLVPLNDPLEVEAYVEPKDIGYIRPGDSCRIKLDAFDFQRHGVIMGKLKTVSEDAVKSEKTDNKDTAYLARITITDISLKNIPSDFRLVPGMSLKTDISVGSRKVITFLVYPLMRMLDESIREP